MKIPPKFPAIFAIESSCDETALALVGESGQIYEQRLYSQTQIHQTYGGVVPEVASRSHFEVLDSLAQSLLSQLPSSVTIVGLAATCGPGLIGPLIVGVSYARGLAAGWGLPFLGVHHLRGHLASVLLEASSDVPTQKSLKEKAQDIFPALVLLVSGGHTQILQVNEKLEAQALADTADDAAGECFDKAAKLMGLPYPGGPQIEKLASTATDTVQALKILERLPRPKSSLGFSFSGLKTAIRLEIEKNPSFAKEASFCFAVQEAIAESLINGLNRAFEKIPPSAASLKNLVFCGGVSANLRIRQALKNWAMHRDLSLIAPPLSYCTDNAAMIGAAAWIQDPSLALHEIQARISL